jgi:hypothetical protein
MRGVVMHLAQKDDLRRAGIEGGDPLQRGGVQGQRRHQRRRDQRPDHAKNWCTSRL